MYYHLVNVMWIIPIHKLQWNINFWLQLYRYKRRVNKKWKKNNLVTLNLSFFTTDFCTKLTDIVLFLYYTVDLTYIVARFIYNFLYLSISTCKIFIYLYKGLNLKIYYCKLYENITIKCNINIYHLG